ncbi:hypothetical protein RugamoR1_58100 [Rugamonas sp. R1(2021)]
MPLPATPPHLVPASKASMLSVPVSFTCVVGLDVVGLLIPVLLDQATKRAYPSILFKKVADEQETRSLST